MVEVLVPVSVFVAFVLIVGQLARLFSNVSLNRTLRDALRESPESVPILAERLNARQPWADALIGWALVAMGVGLVLMSLFESVADRRQVLEGAIVPAVTGIFIILYVRWAKRESDALPARTIPTAVAAAPATRPRAPRRPARSKG